MVGDMGVWATYSCSSLCPLALLVPNFLFPLFVLDLPNFMTWWV